MGNFYFEHNIYDPIDFILTTLLSSFLQMEGIL